MKKNLMGKDLLQYKYISEGLRKEKVRRKGKKEEKMMREKFRVGFNVEERKLKQVQSSQQRSLKRATESAQSEGRAAHKMKISICE